MSAEFFLDTNIFIYSFSQSDLEKRFISQQLIQHALDTRRGIISYQVMQEFINVASRKLQAEVDASALDNYLVTVLEPLFAVSSSPSLYKAALACHRRYRFSFYDSLIVASALQAGCSILYTEDLQHGQRIDSLELVNPFIKDENIHEPRSKYEVVHPNTGGRQRFPP